MAWLGALLIGSGIVAGDGDAAPVQEFERIGTIELATPPSPEVPGSVIDFVIDPKDRFVALRYAPSGIAVFDANGAVKGSIEPIDAFGCGPLAVDANGRVVVVHGDPEGRERLLESIDPTTLERSTVRLAGGVLPFERVIGTGCLEGSRIVLATSNRLRCWDARDGRRIWELDAGDGLANVDALCVTSNGRIAILDADGERGIQFVQPEGRLGPYVRLPESGDPRSRRFADVLPARDGGLWLVESDEIGMRIVRVDVDAKPLETLRPRYADGGRFYGDVAVDRSGALWVHEKAAFVLLGPDGVVDRVVGEVRGSAPLRDAVMVRLGPDGLLHAVSERDRSVHVFDDSGRRVRFVRPSGYAEGTGAQSGLGAHAWIEKHWYPIGATPRRWEVEDRVVRLVDPELGEVRSYREDERSGGEFLFRRAGVSNEGELAVSVFRSTESDHELLHVVILEPNREDVRKIRLPEKHYGFPAIAFDGRRIAVAGEGSLELLDATAGTSVRRQEFPRRLPSCGFSPDTSPRIDFAPNGTELWLRRGDHGTTIERYALP